MTFIQRELFFLATFLLTGLSVSSQQKVPFISKDIPQVIIEERIVAPMPQYSIDGFNAGIYLIEVSQGKASTLVRLAID